MNPNSTISGRSLLAPYASRNIRLSSALWAMQFVPRIESEPATLVVDAKTQKPVVTFWHEHDMPPEAPVYKTFAGRKETLKADDVGKWWEEPGKYSIEGYDDALTAMRRVHECREWLIGVIKGKFRVAGDGRLQKNSLTTDSLHVASCIMAAGCPLSAFNRKTFIFDKKAGALAGLIHDASESVVGEGNSDLQRKTLNEYGRDLCIDWMYAALVCRDRLMGYVKQCIAQIEQRDGDRVLRLSSQMPKTLRREFMRRW